MNRKLKHIQPGTGLGELVFGLDKKSVLEILGEADNIVEDVLDDARLVEMWEYKELGLSLRFDGSKLMQLTSLSIISSYYEYNGVSIIGKTLEEVKEALGDVKYEVVIDKRNANQKLVYAEELSLVIIFEYDTATSLSWDPSEMDPAYARKLQKFNTRKTRQKQKRLKKRRTRARGKLVRAKPHNPNKKIEMVKTIEEEAIDIENKIRFNNNFDLVLWVACFSFLSWMLNFPIAVTLMGILLFFVFVVRQLRFSAANGYKGIDLKNHAATIIGIIIIYFAVAVFGTALGLSIMESWSIAGIAIAFIVFTNFDGSGSI